jgi:hypothetical protein
MGADLSNRTHVTLPAVSRRRIVWIATTAALLTTGVMTSLWWVGTKDLTGPQLTAARFDAVKIGLSVGAGSGGMFALYLGWRRQRSTEADLDNRERMLAHQERIANDTRADATERRITELYTKGVEQLGSDKAPVRLGGLYALERLAQDNPLQRRTIVNVFCAYLRMPYVLPGAEHTDNGEDEQRVQEREVRQTAQRILRDHLRQDSPEQPGVKFWPNMEIDLTGANLIDLDLSQCAVPMARFQSAVFSGTASFESTTFGEEVTFESALFTSDADFRKTVFASNAFFSSVNFAGDVVFESTRFAGSGMFESAVFGHHAAFESVKFGSPMSFEGATFAQGTPIEITRFLL